MEELINYYNKYKYGEDEFHDLMKYRVQSVLLISTYYDAFIFEQDGRLSEQVFGEFRDLNLSSAPKIVSVPTGNEALEILRNQSFDLIISMMRIGKVSPVELSKKVKKKNPDQPIILLLNMPSDVLLIKNNQDIKENYDAVFLWKGDSKIFLAMLKYVEDKKMLNMIQNLV